MGPFIFLDTTSFRNFKVVHYCRLFEHRVARWTYLPNYIFWFKYRIRCSIYSSYRSSSICCHRNDSNFKLCVTKANSYNITITYVFSRLIYYCPCLVQLLSGMPFHSQNITKIKINKNRQWGTKAPLPIFITHAALIKLLTPQNYALHMSV